MNVIEYRKRVVSYCDHCGKELHGSWHVYTAKNNQEFYACTIPEGDEGFSCSDRLALALDRAQRRGTAFIPHQPIINPHIDRAAEPFLLA